MDDANKNNELLNEYLQIVFNQKMTTYKSEYDRGSNYLFFYLSDFTFNNNNLTTTKFTFNYYILIEKKIYKKFKKSQPSLNGYSIDYNDNIQYNIDTLIVDLIKFVKLSYNKNIVNINEITYIKIKLRLLNNTFIPYLKLLQFNIGVIDLFNKIKIIAVPVKKRYTNLIKLQDDNYFRTDKDIDINSEFILSLHLNKNIEETIEYIKNNEKIILEKYDCYRGYIKNSKNFRQHPIIIKTKNKI